MKWSTIKAAQEAKCSLQIEDIIGGTQTDRAGLSSTSNKVFSKGEKRHGKRRSQDV